MSKPDQRPLYDFEVGSTITDCLIECVDGARQILTEFGQRPYRVFLVWIAWTADEDNDGMLQEDELDLESLEPDPDIIHPVTCQPVLLAPVGVGVPVVVAEVELLPTPRVTGVGNIGQNVDAVGRTESGAVTVDQISYRLSEDLLQGLLPPFRVPGQPDQMKDGLEFFWEIQQDRPGGYITPGYEACEQPTDMKAQRRRFAVQGIPEAQSGDFQWMVTLMRADGERSREGFVDTIDGNPPEAPDFRKVNRLADPLLQEEDDF